MSESCVSEQISQLEVRLQARLLQRTTRKLTPIEVGEIFLGKSTGPFVGLLRTPR